MIKTIFVIFLMMSLSACCEISPSMCTLSDFHGYSALNPPEAQPDIVGATYSSPSITNFPNPPIPVQSVGSFSTMSDGLSENAQAGLTAEIYKAMVAGGFSIGNNTNITLTGAQVVEPKDESVLPVNDNQIIIRSAILVNCYDVESDTGFSGSAVSQLKKNLTSGSSTIPGGEASPPSPPPAGTCGASPAVAAASSPAAAPAGAAGENIDVTVSGNHASVRTGVGLVVAAVFTKESLSSETITTTPINGLNAFTTSGTTTSTPTGESAPADQLQLEIRNIANNQWEPGLSSGCVFLWLVPQSGVAAGGYTPQKVRPFCPDSSSEVTGSNNLATDGSYAPAATNFASSDRVVDVIAEGDNKIRVIYARGDSNLKFQFSGTGTAVAGYGSPLIISSVTGNIITREDIYTLSAVAPQ